MSLTTTDTHDVLQEMFKEDTGQAMMDSGGEPQFDEAGNYTGSKYGYGRNHERNQARNFDAEPLADLRFSTWGSKDEDPKLEVDFTFSTYQWLIERLDYDAEMDARFHKFAEQPEHSDTPWLGLMEEFASGRPNASGIYGDGDPMTVNTYNHENLLDQTLQFTYWEEGEGHESYVLLQVHGGADVRGGYTKPRAFTVNNSFGDLAVFDYAEGRMGCGNEDCDARWYTDDGYHWYNDEEQKRLEDYPLTEAPEVGGIHVNGDEDTASCPICAKGLLVA